MKNNIVKFFHIDTEIPEFDSKYVGFYVLDSTNNLYLGTSDGWKQLTNNNITNEIEEIIKNNLTFNLDGFDLQVKFGENVVGSITLPSSGDIPCTSLTVEQLNVNLVKNSTSQIVATKTPLNTKFDIEYFSSDDTKATVSEDGVITWVSGGEITVGVYCGTQSVTVTVNCDELLNTAYEVNNISQSKTYIPCDETSVDLTFTGKTTETWSVSGDEVTTENLTETVSLETNLTDDEKIYTGSKNWNEQNVSYEVTQSPLTLLPYRREFSYSQTNKGAFIQKGTTETSNRRTIAKLRDTSSEHMYLTTGIYDFIYIPADTQTLTVTWDSPNNSVYYAANLINIDGTRIHDAGWNYNTGTWTYDMSDVHEGCWLGGNFKYYPETEMSDMTFEDVNFSISRSTIQNWETLSTSVPAKTNNSNAIQGMDVYNGYLYQFYNGTGGCLKYNLSDLTEAPVYIPTPDENLHYGSVAFSNITTYGSTTTTTPLLFATGHYMIGDTKYEVVDVIDLDNNVLVKQYKFTNRNDDCIAAWDFENSKMWLIGYEPLHGYATGNWYIDTYSIANLSDPTNTFATEIESCYFSCITDNTLQDCKFKDGHIYILTGWGNATQFGSVWDFDTVNDTINKKTVSDSHLEFEGLACLDDYMICSTNGPRLFKVLYNFDCVTNTIHNILDVEQEGIAELRVRGCEALNTVIAQYGEDAILDAVNGLVGLNLHTVGTTSSNDTVDCTWFNTGYIPVEGDIFGAKFYFKDSIEQIAKTLFCSRTNGSNISNSTFIVNSNLRADMGKVGSNQFAVSPNVLYDYTQDMLNGKVSLNNLEKTVSDRILTWPQAKLIVGHSVAGVDSDGNPTGTRSNPFVGIVSTIRIFGQDGMYKKYFIAVDDDTFVDLVSGNTITNLGSGTAEYVVTNTQSVNMNYSVE